MLIYGRIHFKVPILRLVEFIGAPAGLQFFLAPSLATEGGERSIAPAFDDVHYDMVRRTLHVYSLNEHFEGWVKR